MFKNIYWSATSELEISEIRQQVKAKKGQFFIAEDLPRRVGDRPPVKRKVPEELEVVWISRIAPKKNLKGAVRILQRVKGRVHFTIYGPIYTEEYWWECQCELQALPENVTWEYRGNVESEQVVETLKPYHVFLFPTLGENYGHVIQEALSAGCACILSDQTPWRDLEANGAGYVFPIEDTDGMAVALERYAAMGKDEFDMVCAAAYEYAVRVSNHKVEESGYRQIFELRE